MKSTWEKDAVQTLLGFYELRGHTPISRVYVVPMVIADMAVWLFIVQYASCRGRANTRGGLGPSEA